MEVKVIRHYGDVVLIEYRSDRGLERCFLPEDEVAGISTGEAKVSKSKLEKGAPYGVDLELTMTSLTFDPSALMYALRERGIWTMEDYKANPKAIQGALRWLFGADVNRVIEAAENSMKEVG